MKRTNCRIVILFIVLPLLSGCMLLNPTKRRPVEIVSYNENVQPIQKTVLVNFQEFISQKPLAETVWDNNGPFWDQKESKQIGFTQNYQIMTVPGAATAVNTGTRIVIPFGRYVTEMTKSAVKKTFSESSFCYDTSCMDAALSLQSFDYVLSIGIENFRVWETYMNKINYSSDLKYSRRSSKETNTGNVKKTITDKSIGSPLSTSYSFISTMKEITNDYTQDIVTELLSKASVVK